MITFLDENVPTPAECFANTTHLEMGFLMQNVAKFVDLTTADPEMMGKLLCMVAYHETITDQLSTEPTPPA